MAPQMAAFVVSSAVVFMFLLVCLVFSYIPAISLTRDELLYIRKYTPPDISLDLVYSNVLLDIVVGGAAVLFRRFRTSRRGKRAGALAKLCRRGFRTPLPSICLANLRSLPNKTGQTPAFPVKQGFFKLCCSVFLRNLAERRHCRQHASSSRTFSWSDRDAESTGKSCGSGTCFYINERWCTDVTVLKKMCCSDLETLFINFKPFFRKSMWAPLCTEHRTTTPRICFNHSWGL